MLLKIILILVAILFIITLIVKRFVYYHPTYSFVMPQDTYTDIHKGNLHAWYKKGASDKVILFCHGNTGNLSHRQSKLVEFTKMGHSVLIFDYSGFGQSKGVPNEELFYNNASTYLEYLLSQGYKRENIIPYGESMGAAVASFVAKKYGLQTIIIESGLPGIKYLIKSWNKILGLFGFIFNEFDTCKCLKGFTGKILFIHSNNDEVIPISLAQQMWRNAQQPTVLVINGSHNNPQIPWKEVDTFISDS